MIKLDETTWVASADDVRAIRGMLVPIHACEHPAQTLHPGYREDPSRCQCLIGGVWVEVKQGADAVAAILEVCAED